MAKKPQAGEILANNKAVQTALEIINQAGTEEAPAKKSRKRVIKKAGRPKEHTEEYERLSLALPASVKRHLEQLAFDRSEPGRFCSQTQLLIDLIEAEYKRSTRRKEKENEA